MRQNSSGNYISDKAPGETLDYGFDWSAWLQTSETISSSVWSADSGLTVSNQAKTGGVTSAFISGGTLGQSLVITNTITTSTTPPRIAVRTITLTIKSR